MKKIILLAAVLVSTFAQAQIISVTGKNGQPITNDYEFVTNDLGITGPAALPIHVSNLTGEDIYVKLRMDAMENADNMEDMPGIAVQFCFGQLCYTEVEVDDVVPSGIGTAKIVADGQNDEADHFANNYPGDVEGVDVVYYMSLVQYNPDNTPGDVLLSFSYRYTTTAGVNNLDGLQNMGITVKNTVVKSNLELDAAIMANLDIIDVNGKLIKNVSINEGANTIDLSGLSAGVYFAKFTTGMNKSSQIKIVKN